MAVPPDLDAWFARLGYRGSPSVSIQTLSDLIRLHLAAIPFENLSPLLGEPVLLDLPSLQDKLLHRRRGGWCFEHNRLLWVMLSALGFEVQGLAARVLWQLPAQAQPPRTHMLLRLRVDGEDWLADVGFGGLSVTAPLRLQADAVQVTPLGCYRLVRLPHAWRLEAQLAGDWAPLYAFDLQPQQPQDYEATNWWLATHPQSRFLGMLAAARAGDGQRHALRDGLYTCRDAQGAVIEQRQLSDAGQAIELLQTVFGIEVPAGAAVHARLAGLLPAAAGPA